MLPFLDGRDMTGFIDGENLNSQMTGAEAALPYRKQQGFADGSFIFAALYS